MVQRLNYLLVIIVVVLGIWFIRESTKYEQYSNRIVKDVKTGEKFVHEINDIVEVGDTITIFMDTTKVTVKVIK